MRYRTGGNGFFVGSISLPTGAVLSSIEIDGCDASLILPLDLTIYKCPTGGGNCSVVGALTTGDSESPGCGLFALPISEILDQRNFSYHAEAFLGSTTRIRVFARFASSGIGSSAPRH